MHKLVTFSKGSGIITKRGNLENTKKKGFTTRSLLSLEAQRAQRIELDRIDRIFLNLGCWIP